MQLLDTAPVYGESERRIGASGFAQEFRIVTKMPPREWRHPDWSVSVRHGLRCSLERLGVPSVHGLLVHASADLLAPDGRRLFDDLVELREEGLVAKLGVSTYAPREIEELWETFELDLVQLPLSILDQRALEGGHLVELDRRGVEVHARSVFLRGLLLARDRLPECFARLEGHLETLHRRLAAMGMSPLEGALAFALSVPGVDVVLCGVDGCTQLEEILAVGCRPSGSLSRMMRTAC